MGFSQREGDPTFPIRRVQLLRSTASLVGRNYPENRRFFAVESCNVMQLFSWWLRFIPLHIVSSRQKEEKASVMHIGMYTKHVFSL